MAESLDDNQSQEFLSSVIKGVHCQLREDYVASGRQCAEVWKKHLEDSKTLKKYSSAMQLLATGPWRKKHDEGSRITWCVDAIKEYFGGKLKQLLEKDLRRLGYGNPTQVEKTLLPESQEEISQIIRGFSCKRLQLLDVGSCYNPFKEYKDYDVTAIDIAPATEGVLQCDFLSVSITSEKDRTENTAFTMCPESFDIVVFSLLLSYLPSTQQRMLCCINAHKVLKLHGILLIVTVDSSHQNRHVDMMKSWKNGIESVGFHRWKYEKETHLHCIGFRKTKMFTDDTCLSDNHHTLFISQDNHHISCHSTISDGTTM